MNTDIASRNPKKQRGAATLVIAMILLFGVTLVVLFTAGSTYMEIRMSANEVRARQAHAAAQAGLDYGIAWFNENDGARDADGGLSTDVVHAATLENETSYSVRFCALDATLNEDCTCVGNPDARQALIYACGWSDDETAIKRISQAVAGFDAIPGGGRPESPLVSRGPANVLGGTATIINYYTNMTVWTGESVAGQSNTSTTLIRDKNEDIPQMVLNEDGELVWPDAPDPFEHGSPGCNNPPTGYVCTSQGSDFGPDVIYSDTSLSEQLASGDAYFQNFFGTSLDMYKASLKTENIKPAANINDVKGTEAEGQVYWIEGTTTIGQGGQIGSPDKPVVLIIDGNLNLNSGVTIYGVVYVTGNMSGTGTPTIYGSLVVAGSTTPSGTLRIVYDPNVIRKAGGDPTGRKSGTLQGTWRDWL